MRNLSAFRRWHRQLPPNVKSRDFSLFETRNNHQLTEQVFASEISGSKN